MKKIVTNTIIVILSGALGKVIAHFLGYGSFSLKEYMIEILIIVTVVSILYKIKSK